jgi:hypothetical protein
MNDTLVPVIATICAFGVAGYLAWVLFGLAPDMLSRSDRGKMRAFLQLQTGKRHLFLLFFGSKKRIVKMLDDASSRTPEIRDHKEQRMLLKGIPGNRAEKQRERLRDALDKIYETPRLESEIDGNAYVDYIQPQLDALHALRADADRNFFEGRAEKLAELNG